jgi:serine/threonine protein kinase
LTEYGLAVINSDPRFAVAAAPGVIGTSRWLAPEIIDPSDNGDGISAMESKPADVFAFAMLAVEVFTGSVPFEGQTSAMAASRVLRGERPEMPGNAQDVGLTGEMWKLLESCWQQDPEKRPTMDEVVRRWQKFVDRNDNTTTRCVQIPRVIGTSPLIPFSTFS